MAWRALGLMLLAGCTGDLVELSAQPLRVDMARAPAPSPTPAPPAGDLAEAPSVDAGLARLDLAPLTVRFADVQADIDTLGCSAAACHGGSQTPVLKPMPVSLAANDAAFKPFANTGAQSPVLTRNLTGSGVNHTGGKSFASTNDVVYQRWLLWIEAGNPP